MHVQSYCFANLNLLLFFYHPVSVAVVGHSVSYYLGLLGRSGRSDHHKETRLNPNTKPNLTLTLTPT